MAAGVKSVMVNALMEAEGYTLEEAKETLEEMRKEGRLSEEHFG